MGIKKRLLALVVVLLLFQITNQMAPNLEIIETVSGSGQVNVGGIISSNTTWKNTSGPYVVKSHILVDKNSTLTIEPNVTVKFDGYYYIKIQGDLVAKGTEEEMITFTSNKAEKKLNDWDKIDLSDVQNETRTTIQFSLMEYCNVGIWCEDSSVDIRNNTIKNFGWCGIYCSKSVSKINEKETRHLNITGNRVLDGGGDDAICLSWYRNVSIKNNFISNHSGNAIRFYCPENSPLVQNNTIMDVYTGIMVQGTDSIIEGNIITYCKNYGIKLQGYSTWISKPVIRNNTLGANGASIFIHGQCKPLIRYNNFIKDYTYSIEHGGNIDNNASYNYWGTSNSTRIREKIFDFYDDYNKPKVLFEPILMNRSDGAPNVTINLPPVADGGPNLEVNRSEWFVLNASRSYDLEGDPLMYKWEIFGLETIGWTNSSEVDYRIMDFGTYDARLYVTDGNRESIDYLRIKVNHVYLEAPVAMASASHEIIYEGENLTLNSSASYDPDGEIINRSWYSSKEGLIGYDEMIVVELGLGLHEISLMVIDDDGLYDQAKLYVAVAENRSGGNGEDPDPDDDAEIPPVPHMNFSKMIIDGGETITLDGSRSYDSDGNITQYVWSSDIQGLLGTETIMEIVLVEGLHIIRLTVFDEQGLKNSTSATVLVKERTDPGQGEDANIPPVAIMEFLKMTIDDGEVMILDGSLSHDPDGNITVYLWSSDIQGELGNGISIEVVLEIGLHIVELKVKDEQNITNSTYAAVLVKELAIPHKINIPPIPSASASSIKLVGPGMVTLDGSGSYDPDGTVTSYKWRSSVSGHLGEGRTIRVELGIGTHLISLVVMDDDGISNSTYLAVSVIEEVAIIIDSDGDGVLNDNDAFPNDPSASIDTDQDGYPNIWNPGMDEGDSITGLELDQYPEDSERWSREPETSQDQDRSIIWVIALLMLILFVIAVGMVIVRGDRRSGDERKLRRLRKEINDENQFGIKRSAPINRSSRLEEMKEGGEISGRTYREIKGIIEKDETRENR